VYYNLTIENIIKETFSKYIIKDFNIEKSIEVNADQTILECSKLLSSNGISCLIVNSGRKKGIVSRGDILKSLKWADFESYSKSVGDVANYNLIALSYSDSLWDAIVLISKRNIRQLPILQGNSIIGFLNILEILKLILSTNAEIFKDFNIIKDCFADKIKTEESIYEIYDEKSLDVVFKQSISQVKPIIDSLSLIDKNESINNILTTMQTNNLKNIVVTEFGVSIIGIISENDFFNKCFSCQNFQITLPELMTLNPHRMRKKHYVGNAMKTMVHFNHRNMILVDEDNFPISLITATDLLNYLVNIWDK